MTDAGPPEPDHRLLDAERRVAEAEEQVVLVWVSQHTNTKLATITERFLVEVDRTELGEAPRETVTLLLAHLDHPDETTSP